MKIHLLFLLMIAALTSCSTTSTNSPQNASTGDLKGIVGLYDTHGNRIADKSGVLVKAEGTSITTVSDASGHWVLHDLPTQTYVLTFSKDGYSTIKNTSYSFVGGGTVLYSDTVFLCQPLTMTITLDSASGLTGKPTYDSKLGFVSGHISGADLADTMFLATDILFGLSPNLDSAHLGGSHLHYPMYNTGAVFTKKGDDIIFSYNNWEYCADAFDWTQHGTTIYLKAYLSTFNAYNARYYDVISDKWINPNPTPVSNTLKVVIP